MEEAFALVKEADSSGTSPGKNLLKTLLETYAPCVVPVNAYLIHPEDRLYENWTTIDGFQRARGVLKLMD